MSGPLLQRAAYEVMQRIARVSGVRRAAMAWSRAGDGATAPAECTDGADPVLSAKPLTDILADLQRDGVAPWLTLRPEAVAAILAWAKASPCYAYDNPAHGFLPADRERAEAALGRPILKAVYYLPERQCDAMRALCDSPVVHAIARAYLGHHAKLVSRQLWWTFPTQADEKTRRKVAHYYHRDIDDWAFLKFFFYVTPVQLGDGSHHFVRGSHRPGWKQLSVEALQKTRWTDERIRRGYGAERMIEFHGDAGMGFAEDTFGVHKAASPSMQPRLMASLVFQLHDYRLENHEGLDTRMLVPPAGALVA